MKRRSILGRLARAFNVGAQTATNAERLAAELERDPIAVGLAIGDGLFRARAALDKTPPAAPLAMLTASPWQVLRGLYETVESPDKWAFRCMKCGSLFGALKRDFNDKAQASLERSARKCSGQKAGHIPT